MKRIAIIVPPVSSLVVAALLVAFAAPAQAAVGTAVDVVTDGAYAYVASQEYGVVVVDVRNAANPLAVGATEVGFVPTYLDGEGTIVVAAGGDAGMAVVDVSDPASPVWVSSVSEPAHEVTVAGGHAYISDATAGTPGYLRIVDVSEPSAPAVVAEVELGRLPREVAIVGDYAYVATSNKICVLDVSVPAAPSWVSSPPIGCARITAKPGFAYIPGGMVSGIAVVDTQNPTALAVVGEAESLCYLNRFVVQGNLVYAAGTSIYTSIPYLQIFDVTTPTAPVTTSYGTISGTGTAESVAVSGAYAYVADGPDGLKVMDVADPYHPVIVGRASASIFADVPMDHPFRLYIEAIYREGITGGCTQTPLNYCPTSTVTRGQMASFICKAAGQTWYDPGSATFGDVPRGTNGVWDGGGGGGYDVDGTFIFYGWIERLADPASWGGTAPTGGCTATTYCPANGVTRGQMSKFLCIAAGQTWYDPGSATFGDVSRGSNGTYDTPETDGTHVFYGYVERLADAASWGGTAVTGGCGGGNYCPTNPVTRGQMAIFLCRAFGIPY
ncbi:MAG: hypothetical protein JSV65_08825 [Armatimonadota bacterium]|nr:MAG: hypothetical protein JSV65_08825 [Armatimonadota bacterium]